MHYPKDKYIIPLCVPAVVVLVTALNNDPLHLLVLEKWFWRDFIAGVLIAATIWLIIRYVSIRLNTPFSWKTSFFQRFIFQTLFGWAVPSILLFFLCWAMFEWVIGQSMFETFFPHYEFPFAVLFLACINGYYLVYSLLEKDFPTPDTLYDSVKKGLFPFKGADKFPLPYEKIEAVIKNTAYLDVFSSDGPRLNISATMESLEKTLPQNIFFRLNRQAIINIKNIRSFRSIENGKIEVYPKRDDMESSYIVSQKKAALFRKWLSENIGSITEDLSSNT